ncbi:unnamed protein product [Brachionus calyciflorus]|uniref:G patch domain-containing protein 11 n=1 Tax=Brachionus calyciflorus TaxID=104777 RepID=A0A813Z1F4_9BILA|nr:unnamed protein product [Brachionus calyciflorus]
MSCKKKDNSVSFNHDDEAHIEDEDDYMSDKLLNQIGDTRPGLVFNRETARKYDLEKKIDLKNRQNRQLSVKELEELKRNEALKTSALKTDNKGFNLMLKMGYKKGESLGKNNKTEEEKSGLIEPIPIEIKTDREGLGQSSERKQKLEEIKKLRENLGAKKRAQEKDFEKSYLMFKRGKFNLRKVRYNLHKCQRICYQLDSAKGIKNPEVSWYWPANITEALRQQREKFEPKIESKKEIIEEAIYTETELSEDLSKTSDYKETILIRPERGRVDLKQVYDERLKSFLETNELVDSKKIENTNNEDETEEESDYFVDNDYNEQVRLEKTRNEGEELSDIDEDEKNEIEENNEELMFKKIDSICLYLREKYFYCVWCATTFSNEQDMSQNCPGLSEKDHEEDEQENE